MPYTIEGWFSGESDCEPPEPDKQWLVIADDAGEEFCIIVQRQVYTEPSWQGSKWVTTRHFDPSTEQEKYEHAEMIVDALNRAFGDVCDEIEMATSHLLNARRMLGDERLDV